MWTELTNYLNQHYKVNVYKEKIHNDILRVFDNNTSESREAWLENYFQNIITSKILDDSFSTTQVFYMYDIMPTELVFLLHNYFLKKCCNRENIVIICPSQIGLFDWWEQYKALMGIKSIVFIDAPFIGMLTLLIKSKIAHFG